jgi:hypothetical protein
LRNSFLAASVFPGEYRGCQKPWSPKVDSHKKVHVKRPLGIHLPSGRVVDGLFFNCTTELSDLIIEIFYIGISNDFVIKWWFFKHVQKSAVIQFIFTGEYRRASFQGPWLCQIGGRALYEPKRTWVVLTVPCHRHGANRL